MFILTTKKIYDLNIGESVVLSVDDIEYKLLKNLDNKKYEWFIDKTQNERALVTRLT